jgi:DNA-directed RNA polymerase subunit RPC12/RpoP
MSVQVTCSGCGRGFSARDELAGKTVRCPNCKTPIAVESAPANSGLADFLGEELSAAEAKQQAAQAAAMQRSASEPKHRGRTCRQCGDPMPEGARFCVGCGLHDYDGDAELGKAAATFLAEEKKNEQRECEQFWLLRVLSVLWRWV